MNKDFLKQVLVGEKQLLKMAKVKPVNVPNYDELSVKRLYPLLKEDPELSQYLPDVTSKSRLPARDYFFTVLNTLQPAYLEAIIKKAQDSRLAVTEESNKIEAIYATQEWVEQLSMHPFMSSKLPETNS